MKELDEIRARGRGDGCEVHAECIRADMARLLDLLESAHNLIRDLTDAEACYFDHHGGCQAHGYLDLVPGELCPQQEAKNWLSEDAALTPTPAAPDVIGGACGAVVTPVGTKDARGAQSGTEGLRGGDLVEYLGVPGVWKVIPSNVYDDKYVTIQRGNRLHVSVPVIDLQRIEAKP